MNSRVSADDGASGSRTNKQAQILAEACRLFAARGFNGTSIRDIASAAGMTNAGLYHYFADKNDLFAQIVINVIEQQCSFTEQRMGGAMTATEKLRAFMRAYGEFFEAHTSECIASSRSFRILENSPQRDQAIYWRDRYEGILRDILRQGMESGEFRDGDVALTGRAVLSCLNWLHRWYSPSGRLKPVEIVSAYADIMLGGIGSGAKR